MPGQPQDSDLHMILPELPGALEVIREESLGCADQHQTGFRHDHHAEREALGIQISMLRDQERGLAALRSDGNSRDDSGLTALKAVFIDQFGALSQCRVVGRYLIPYLDFKGTNLYVGHMVILSVSSAGLPESIPGDGDELDREVGKPWQGVSHRGHGGNRRVEGYLLSADGAVSKSRTLAS